MFGRKKQATAAISPPPSRLVSLVREMRDRPATVQPNEVEANGAGEDVMALLVELRAAAKRGSEPAGARRLGPEFTRYLSEFYVLPAALQPSVIETLLTSRRQRDEGDLDAAIKTCETALQACPGYLPYLERLAVLEMARGETARAERWYSRLLVELERLEQIDRALEIGRRLVQSGIQDPELLERCAGLLTDDGDSELGAEAWSRRAATLLEEGRASDALSEVDRALSLQPDSAYLYLQLGEIFEQLRESARAAAAFDQAEALAGDDATTMAKILLIRARVGQPDDESLGRLLDLLESRPRSRATAIEAAQKCAQDNAYNPHLRYVLGLLLSQDGQLEEGAAALRVAIDRYAAQSDHTSELRARLAMQRIVTHDEANHRRIAALYFERGEVHLAMQALAHLARASRR